MTTFKHFEYGGINMCPKRRKMNVATDSVTQHISQAVSAMYYKNIQWV